jgi:ATP/maltotriose-dependent transcriptional regulator MalT
MGFYENSIAAFRSGDTGRAEELALELLSLARDEGDISGQVDGLCMLARVALRRGDLERVSALAGEARALARRAGERRLERMPIHLQAVAVRMSADYSGARLLYEESIALNVQLGEERMVAIEHRNLAYVELHDGHADRARQLFTDAAREARALGYDALEPFLLLDAAVVAFEDGDRHMAARLAAATRAALAEAGQIPDPDDAAEEEWLEADLFWMGPS